MDIELKLNNFLKKHGFFKEECEVVYLMVELRKFLDRKNITNKYTLLRFYCDWVVHTKKSKHMNFIKGIMDDIDKEFPKDGIKYMKSNLEFLNFTELRKEIFELFGTNKIVSSNFTDDKKWVNFTDLLVKVLVDSPLAHPHPNISFFNFEKVADGRMVKIIFKDNRGIWSVGMSNEMLTA